MGIVLTLVYGILLLMVATLVATGFAPGFHADMLRRAKAKGRTEDALDRVTTAGAAFLGLWIATFAAGVLPGC